MSAQNVLKFFKNVFFGIFWIGLFILMRQSAKDGVTAVLMYASLFLFWAFLVRVVTNSLGRKISPEKCKGTDDSLTIVFSLALFFSIFTLRFSVSYFEIKDNINWLYGIEKAVGGLLMTTKTFGVDDNYPQFL